MGQLTTPKVAVLALLAALTLTLGAIAAPFSMDELHYSAVALQVANGGAQVPGHEGLPMSSELTVFRPGRMTFPDELEHLSPVAPPLYGVIAWPFLWMGWRGLVLLNVLAFLGTLLLVAEGARTLDPRRGQTAARLAVVTMLAGGFLVEYAPAVWPHAVSVFLVTAAVVTGMKSRLMDRPWLAAVAGACIALSAGVRFQNAFLLGLLGLATLLGAGRWRRATAFGLGAAPFVVLSSLLNHARAGIWHPFSKSSGYTRLSLATAEPGGTGPSALERVVEILRTTVVRIVDYGFHPPFEGAYAWKSHFLRLSEAGVVTTHQLAWEGPVRKALLQSCPWALAALVLAATAVWGMRASQAAGGSGGGDERARSREIALLALLVIANVGLFSLAGLGRDPGLCFNPRYLHEMVPWLAMAAGARAAVLPWGNRAIGAGFALGALGVLAGLLLPEDLGNLWLARAPLLLALAAALALPRARRAVFPAALLAACLGWSAATQCAVDLPASIAVRTQRAALAAPVSARLPDDAVLLAPLWLIDGLGADMLRGATLADPALDGGKAAPEIVRRSLERGRRVFVVPWGPPALYEKLRAEFGVLSEVDLGLDREPVLLLELGAEPLSPRTEP